jgi:hypothetical protein
MLLGLGRHFCVLFTKHYMESGFKSEQQFLVPASRDKFDADYATQQAKLITLCMETNQ